MKLAPAFLSLALAGPVMPATDLDGGLSVTGFSSLQEAIDRNPGCQLFVPEGDHAISAALKITTANAGLWGPGRIIQTNPQAAIIEVTGAPGVQLRGLTLTRAEGKQECSVAALVMANSAGGVFADVRVLDNWANTGAVVVDNCPFSQIRDCLVRNYSRIAIDDRTQTSFHGYAFRCIDGTGIAVKNSTGVMIMNNRIIEERMVPTRELKERHQLGKIIKKNEAKGWHISQAAWDQEYFIGWHQGSALTVNSGESADCVLILGNYIENAAQGIDIHGDHVVMANNIVTNAFIGMKAVHGSRNLLMSGNQFSRNDLSAIGLMPGSASHAAGEQAVLSGGRKSTPTANVDGYSIIANNIISDFGRGSLAWNFPPDTRGHGPIRLGSPGFAEQGKPSLREVLVQGNVIYDSGRDGILEDGRPRSESPNYQYAVRIADGADEPQGLHFSNNLFHPGTSGVARYELKF